MLKYLDINFSENYWQWISNKNLYDHVYLLKIKSNSKCVTQQIWYLSHYLWNIHWNQCISCSDIIHSLQTTACDLKRLRGRYGFFFHLHISIWNDIVFLTRRNVDFLEGCRQTYPSKIVIIMFVYINSNQPINK